MIEGKRLLGESNGQSKLTASEAAEILDRTLHGEKQEAVAEDYGVSRGTVASIYRREKWQHVTTIDQHIHDTVHEWAKAHGWLVIWLKQRGDPNSPHATQWPTRIFISPHGKHVWISIRQRVKGKGAQYCEDKLRERGIAAHYTVSVAAAIKILQRYNDAEQSFE